jgi:hypothetical protein
MEKKLICNKCLVKPICRIACDELLNYNFKLEDFKNEKIILRLIGKEIKKTFKFRNIEIRFENHYCYWYKNGLLHREDGPTVEYSNGNKEWYKNGERHREDGPAIEYSNEYKEWWRNGKRHLEAQLSDLIADRQHQIQTDHRIF